MSPSGKGPAARAGRLLGEPIAVRDATAWPRVRAALADRGAALLHARLADWTVERGDQRAVEKALSASWSRHLALSSPETALRQVAYRRLLKAASAAACDDTGELELCYGPTGRPFLPGLQDFDISLTHTDDLLAIAMTARGLVGVHAESAGRRVNDRLASEICTPYELLATRALPAAERSAALVRLWTLKEAYRKALGQDTPVPFAAFGFGPDDRPLRVRRPDGRPGTGAEWTFESYLLDGRYRIGAAVYDAERDTARDPAYGDLRSAP